MISSHEQHESTASSVIRLAVIPAFITWLLISLAFVSPMMDSTRAPYFDLTQSFAQLYYWISQTGGMPSVIFVAVLMLLLLVGRAGISSVRRSKEIIVIVLVAVFFAGGGAAINEHVVKEQLKTPRPNIIWLAGGDGTGPLGMTADEFYQLGNKQARHEPLARVLNADPVPVAMSARIRAHWIQETGYSLPSGHAFSAMFFATFLLALAATYLKTKRLWLFYALLPWALVVCYSRLVLRVHTPTDIVVGGLQGLVIGLVAWMLARVLLRRLSDE